MAYGKIEYDKKGRPKCEICGKHFDRVISHARQMHAIDGRAYKIRFGFDLKKGICSKSSSMKSREKALANYDKCIKTNLTEKGIATRFKKGGKGRTRDKVSEQTRIRMIERLKKSPMKETMKREGRRLGKSGLGNAVRWGHNKKHNNQNT